MSVFKEKWISAYLDTAERFAQESTAVRLKVGAIVVKDDRIISIGINGTPAGWDNVCEEEQQLPDGSVQLVTKKDVLHAEHNAITKLARSTESALGAAMFCTHAPCIECAKLIASSGITAVYYRDTYRSQDGLVHLAKRGVSVKKVSKNL